MISLVEHNDIGTKDKYTNARFGGSNRCDSSKNFQKFIFQYNPYFNMYAML